MKIKINELMVLGQKAVKSFGYSDSETQMILDVLMYAQLRGNNQGLVKLIGQGIPKDPRASAIRFIKETRFSVLLDGAYNMAIIVANRAVQIALGKAAEHGFGMVGANNTYSSSGAIGYYARAIAEEGLIGCVFASSPPRVCTHGSYEPVFGTNPLAIGVPTTDNPVVLDMATAAIANYGILEAETAGLELPPDLTYDGNGLLTTSPSEALQGAIRPFDRSYKGAALALIVEILAGPLIGARFSGLEKTGTGRGDLILAIDPEVLTNRDTFREQVSQLVGKVKDSKKLPGVDEILVPGERGDRLANERIQSGQLEIEDNLYGELMRKANGENG